MKFTALLNCKFGEECLMSLSTKYLSQLSNCLWWLTIQVQNSPMFHKPHTNRNIMATSASITNVSTSDWQLLCPPCGVGSWPWRICRLWLVDAGACGKNDIPVLCVITSTTLDTTLSTNGYIPDADCRHGALPAGLRQCSAGMSSCLPTSPSSVGA